MRHDEFEKIITEAIHNKLIVEIVYFRQEDGTKTCRLMEPFDIAPARRSQNHEEKFWGWCLTHDRMEQKIIPNIVSVSITEQHFDPSIREEAFSSSPSYWISRRW
jgi:predicted DNA-binding transcriptional regulator YafY